MFKRLTPVVQKQIAWVLYKKGPGGLSRNDLLDRIQDVFVHLLDQDYRVLRSWDPSKGKMEPFISCVAERLTLSWLRSGRRSGWKEDPTLDDSLDRQLGPAPDLESRALTRDALETLLDRLRSELSPQSMELFKALFVEERSVAEVSREFGMTTGAVYSWRHRLRMLVSSWAVELRGEHDLAGRTVSHER